MNIKLKLDGDVTLVKLKPLLYRTFTRDSRGTGHPERTGVHARTYVADGDRSFQDGSQEDGFKELLKVMKVFKVIKIKKPVSGSGRTTKVLRFIGAMSEAMKARQSLRFALFSTPQQSPLKITLTKMTRSTRMRTRRSKRPARC